MPILPGSVDSVLVVQSVDGIARSLVELYDLLTWLHGFGVWLVATNESIDTNPRTDNGRSFLFNLAILVNAEKNMRCRNVREGLARAQSKGTHCGRPPATPFGHK